jgi:hypothetical protein
MKKSLFTVWLAVLMVAGFAFGSNNDPMEFGLKRVKSKTLGKELNLKVAKAKKKKKKKNKKYKEVNDMFANVEYNTPKKKRPTKGDYFNELNELNDLDAVDKYEQNFVKSEGSRAKARRKDKPFVAVNTGKSESSFANQAGGSNLKGKKSVVSGTVSGTTFDSYENDNADKEEIMPAESASVKVAKKDSYAARSAISYSYEPKAEKTSLITLAAAGGYGQLSIAGGRDLLNYGAREWEASDSFLGGVIADLGRGTWQFESGLLYVRTGLKRNVQGMNMFMGSQMDNRIEYLDREYIAVPLVGVFNFSSFFAKAGLWPMYMTSAKTEIYSSMQPDQSADTAAMQAKWEMLATIGLGGKIKLSASTALILEAYYMRGLQDTFNANGMSGNTQGFIGNAGISFDL